jgi:hypothetical protein
MMQLKTAAEYLNMSPTIFKSLNPPGPVQMYRDGNRSPIARYDKHKLDAWLDAMSGSREPQNVSLDKWRDIKA